MNKNIDNNINNNINNNKINNNDNNIKGNHHNNNNKLILNNEPEKDIQIDDLIFQEYSCNSCSTFPIICILYYCSQCQMFLCEDCYNKVGNHIHPFKQFESNQEL